MVAQLCQRFGATFKDALGVAVQGFLKVMLSGKICCRILMVRVSEVGLKVRILLPVLPCAAKPKLSQA